jgi:CTP:molybdopterin cytidylyltransferase MocA
MTQLPVSRPAAPIRVAAVLLAAGSASRMGHRPKCLLELDGEALIRRLIQALQGAGIVEVVVVLGHYAAQIRPRLEGLGVRTIENPDPEEGQVSSQRLGLANLDSTPDAVLVALSDQPLLTASDISDLIEAFSERPAGIELMFPQVDGQRGHPVIFSPSVRDQILADDAQFGGRQWQAANRAKVLPLITHNPNYCIDLDTAEDVERISRETGRSLRWPADSVR